MNLFQYELAGSHLFKPFLSEAFICNFMQFSVQLPLWIMPCLAAFYFSNSVFHRFWRHTKESRSSALNISFPSNLTDNFLTTTLPTLLTSALSGSAVEDNSMLKDRFAFSGMMMSSLPKLGNLTNSNWFWS